MKRVNAIRKWWKIQKKNNINTQQNITLTHSLTRHIQTHGVRMQSGTIRCRRLWPLPSLPPLLLRCVFNMKAHVVLHFVRMLRMNVDVYSCVCSKQEISFYKWTDGFGMLLYAHTREKKKTNRTVGKERERNERMRETRLELENQSKFWLLLLLLCVAHVCFTLCMCMHDQNWESDGYMYMPHGKREWRGRGTTKSEKKI